MPYGPSRVPAETLDARGEVYALGVGCCADLPHLCAYHAGYQAGWKAAYPLDSQAVAELLGVSRKTVARYVCAGEFLAPSGRVGTRPWWQTDLIDAFRDARREGMAWREALGAVDEGGEGGWLQGRHRKQKGKVTKK